ncbi:hypothetical protein C0991_009602 [Blastosporella zonata]|nr:hypothetical protein C0991_009602 [Blastosporella zonata]
MASVSRNANAELLKTEGNALHVSGHFQEAYAKYSEAIKQDPKNPILWANRAASSLSMKKYLDAGTDATKATELDPTYAKAWGRQGTACLSLASYSKSADAFKKALSCLPATGELSAADQLLKTHYEEGLKKAEKQLGRTFKINSAIIMPSDADIPYKRAMAMEPELIAQRLVEHSGFVILAAYREFQEGINGMNYMHHQFRNGQEVVVGKYGVVESLTNAILRDRRAFYITDGEFMNKYNKQVMFEIQHCKAWTSEGPREIQQNALKRLKTLGWGAVRPALSLTVRCRRELPLPPDSHLRALSNRAWLMRGYLQASFKLPGSYVEFVSDALQILEWGARVWKNVPTEERGVIFEDSFIRGVKRLYLNLLFEQSYTHEKTGDMENIAKVAREILDEPLAPPKIEIDPGFVSSFWIYSEADAHIMLGWYFLQKAKAIRNHDEATELYKESAAHYFQGANLFPEDDEKHAMFLKICLEAHWFAGSPLKVTLLIAKHVRETIPEMKRIWEHSADAQSRDRMLCEVLSFETHFNAEIAAGRMNLETSGWPTGGERPRPDHFKF